MCEPNAFSLPADEDLRFVNRSPGWLPARPGERGSR
jgi:hypothetical protein